MRPSAIALVLVVPVTPSSSHAACIRPTSSRTSSILFLPGVMAAVIAASIFVSGPTASSAARILSASHVMPSLACATISSVVRFCISCDHGDSFPASSMNRENSSRLRAKIGASSRPARPKTSIKAAERSDAVPMAEILSRTSRNNSPSFIALSISAKDRPRRRSPLLPVSVSLAMRNSAVVREPVSKPRSLKVSARLSAASASRPDTAIRARTSRAFSIAAAVAENRNVATEPTATAMRVIGDAAALATKPRACVLTPAAVRTSFSFVPASV